MAEARFLIQAVATVTHASAVRKILELPDVQRVLMAVAYVREAGVEAIASALPKQSVCYLGIRNQITSIQGVRRLLKAGVTVYAVDTGGRQIIYHPKLFLAASAGRAKVAVGSANLTFSGLHNNIELSALLDFSLDDPLDSSFVNDVFETFELLKKNHPKHVFQISNDAEATSLLKEGRLADEAILPPPVVVSGPRQVSRDSLKPMSLAFFAPPVSAALKPRTKPLRGSVKTTAVASTTITSVPHLVWRSGPLKERDLNIPSGHTTNPTGSIGLKKGAFVGIDQRHYFRDDVFADLVWTPNPTKKTLERAQATFALVIKGLNYGSMVLDLTHSTDRRSTTYKQGNIMTHLRWGNAKQYVAKKDLLGRTFSLYRRETKPPEFTIEID